MPLNLSGPRHLLFPFLETDAGIQPTTQRDHAHDLQALHRQSS